MASGWASHDYLPDRELVGRVVIHIPYLDKFEAALVRPKEIIAYRVEDSPVPDLCPSLQVPNRRRFWKCLASSIGTKYVSRSAT